MKTTLALLAIIACMLCNAQPLVVGQGITTQLGSANDYSITVIDLKDTYGAPQGLEWTTNKLHPTTADSSDWKYDRVGGVFGICIDSLANFYVAASAAYGTGGEPGTAGWGGIYRINAADWSVDDFVVSDSASSTSSNTIPNSGSGIGNICYDKWHDQLFATNWEDGMIYRIDMAGNILSTFDPNLPDDDLYGIARLGEVLWGVGVYGDSLENVRIYYGLWNSDPGTPGPANQVWSIGLDSGGEFTGTELLELTVPNTMGGSNCPVSDIAFSEMGEMFIACRSMYTNTWSGTLTVTPGAHSSQCFRYSGSSGSFTLTNPYYVGNIDPNTNSAGGIDLGYLQTDSSYNCEELVWVSGDALRFSGSNPDGGTDMLYGVAGLPLAGNSDNEMAPDFTGTTAYMVKLGTNYQKSTFGDVEVYRKFCTGDDPATPPDTIIPPIEPCAYFTGTIPNVFSPNGDHLNDLFEIPLDTCVTMELVIFNRWGQEMFHTTDPGNYWDGMIQSSGNAATEGVYYYILIAELERYSGYLELMR